MSKAIMRVSLKIEGGLDDVRAFVSPDESDPNKASPLAKTVQLASDVAGQAIARQVKTTLMGKASAESRQLSAIESDLSSDALSKSNPLVGQLLGASPSLRKRLTKNPGLMDLLLQYAPTFLSRLPGSMPSGSGNNHKESFKGDLNL